MLLEIEEALRFPMAGLLDRNAHVDAIFPPRLAVQADIPDRTDSCQLET